MHSVTAGMEQYEVCRVFLASLMLANAGNVTLSHPVAARGDGIATDVTMQLHETRMDRPMDSYKAPSSVEGENSAGGKA